MNARRIALRLGLMIGLAVVIPGLPAIARNHTFRKTGGPKRPDCES